MNANARARFATFGQFNIDRWPTEVAALSMPTKLIQMDDPRTFLSLYDYPDGWENLAEKYAAQLDAAMGWGNFFVKLNSRSPKDAIEVPITCSGKQAISWVLQSMRCIDDIVTMWRAEEPIFFCLREVRHIPVWAEVRCFARDGVVIGASRYDYRNEPKAEWDGASIMAQASDFYAEHLARHYSTVVFDILPSDGATLLIELNPYGLSDPCCFGSYAALESVGGFASEAPSS